MSDCIFCKIAAGEIPADKVYEDDKVLAFRDNHPRAPTHVLVIPKKHIASLNEASGDNIPDIAAAVAAIPQVAKADGVAESGYRVISNCGEDGGQTVFHLHFHVLGGRSFGPKLFRGDTAED
ncbi:MAG: histidine triad nucleotide-binding protein [Oscillospiraceae bacterium]|jgi:histidine triad (HIT) family protein|nr:histidine triad nucleotide-binding protein [Oscillospiraceae bacterium]